MTMKNTIQNQPTSLTRTAIAMALSTLFSINAQAGGERDPLLTYLLIDNFEVTNQANSPIQWNATAYIGKDYHKLYLKTEGESVKGATASKNQLLYSMPVETFWDLQMGLGYDTAENKNQTWGVIGLQGLAPYFFATNAVLLANDKNVGFRFDTEYEALITQKLILQPTLAFDAYTSDDPTMGIGSGISSANIGLRLRYEFSRKFAPYVGVEYNATYGKTADYLKAAGESDSQAQAVAGVRFWF